MPRKKNYSDWAEYLAARRETSVLQSFQDRKDALKQRIRQARTDETRKRLIDEFAQAVLDLEAARSLYSTRRKK